MISSDQVERLKSIIIQFAQEMNNFLESLLDPVIPPPVPNPTKVTLLLDSTPIEKGQSTTLHWVIEGDVTSAVLSGIQLILPQQLGGQMTISPPETATYSLTATGPGGSVTKTVTVNVIQPTPPPPDPPPSPSPVGDFLDTGFDRIPMSIFSGGTQVVKDEVKVWDQLDPDTEGVQAHHVKEGENMEVTETIVTKGLFIDGKLGIGGNPGYNVMEGYDSEGNPDSDWWK